MVSASNRSCATTELTVGTSYASPLPVLDSILEILPGNYLTVHVVENPVSDRETQQLLFDPLLEGGEGEGNRALLILGVRFTPFDWKKRERAIACGLAM